MESLRALQQMLQYDSLQIQAPERKTFLKGDGKLKQNSNKSENIIVLVAVKITEGEKALVALSTKFIKTF